MRVYGYARVSTDGKTLTAVHRQTSTVRRDNRIAPTGPMREVERKQAEHRYLLHCHPSIPVKTVPEFVAYAKANPGKISFGSAGNGSAVHMAGELFKMMADVDMTHVPYRGEAAALTDLLGGRLQVVFGTMSSSIEYVRTGQLRALAVTSSTRSALLPNIATVSEFIPGFEAAAWAGIGAPRRTPHEIVTELNKEANACLSDSKIGQRLADFGGTALSLSPAEFGKDISNETEKWGKVIKFAGIKLNE